MAKPKAIYGKECSIIMFSIIRNMHKHQEILNELKIAGCSISRQEIRNKIIYLCDTSNKDKAYKLNYQFLIANTKSFGRSGKRSKYVVNIDGLLEFIQNVFFEWKSPKISKSLRELLAEYLELVAKVHEVKGEIPYYYNYSIYDVLENFIIGLGRYKDQIIESDTDNNMVTDLLNDKNPRLKGEISAEFILNCLFYYKEKYETDLNILSWRVAKFNTKPLVRL